MEISELLKESRDEIIRLRRANELLRAKVEVMDSFMCVLHTKPPERLETASPDVVWQMDQAIKEIESNRANDK